MINALTNHEPALLQKILEYLSGTPQCLCCRAALDRYQIPLVSKTVYRAMGALYVNLAQCPQLSHNIIDSMLSTDQLFLFCWQHRLTFDDIAQLDSFIGKYKSSVHVPIVDQSVQPEASIFVEPQDVRVLMCDQSSTYIHTDNMDSLVYFVKQYLHGNIKIGHFCCGGAGVSMSIKN